MLVDDGQIARFWWGLMKNVCQWLVLVTLAVPFSLPVRAIVFNAVRPICELERFDTTATLLKYIQKHWLPLSQVLVIIQTMYKTESLRPGVRTAIDVVKERIR